MMIVFIEAEYLLQCFLYLELIALCLSLHEVVFMHFKEQTPESLMFCLFSAL